MPLHHFLLHFFLEGAYLTTAREKGKKNDLASSFLIFYYGEGRGDSSLPSFYSSLGKILPVYERGKKERRPRLAPLHERRRAETRGEGGGEKRGEKKTRRRNYYSSCFNTPAAVSERRPRGSREKGRKDGATSLLLPLLPCVMKGMPRPSPSRRKEEKEAALFSFFFVAEEEREKPTPIPISSPRRRALVGKKKRGRGEDRNSPRAFHLLALNGP